MWMIVTGTDHSDENKYINHRVYVQFQMIHNVNDLKLDIDTVDDV